MQARTAEVSTSRLNENYHSNCKPPHVRPMWSQMSVRSKKCDWGGQHFSTLAFRHPALHLKKSPYVILTFTLKHYCMQPNCYIMWDKYCGVLFTGTQWSLISKLSFLVVALRISKKKRFHKKRASAQLSAGVKELFNATANARGELTALCIMRSPHLCVENERRLEHLHNPVKIYPSHM